MLGLTPIAGQNDDNENFTQSNAKTLESFAATNGVDANLIDWSLTDQSFASMAGVLFVAPLAGLRDEFRQPLCRSARSIFLQSVM